MDINCHQFWRQLLPFGTHLADSEFVGLDLEFSGIKINGNTTTSHTSGRSGNPRNQQQFWDEVREAAERYSIVQVGITCLEKDAKRGKLDHND